MIDPELAKKFSLMLKDDFLAKSGFGEAKKAIKAIH